MVIKDFFARSQRELKEDDEENEKDEEESVDEDDGDGAVDEEEDAEEQQHEDEDQGEGGAGADEEKERENEVHEQHERKQSAPLRSKKRPTAPPPSTSSAAPSTSSTATSSLSSTSTSLTAPSTSTSLTAPSLSPPLPPTSVPVTFASLGVCPPLVEACTALGWRIPTPIQQSALPHALAGRDIIGLAETGSGKTGAFAIPLLQSLLSSPSPFFGLIVAPTRELCFQIAEAVEALGSSIGVKVAVLVGGVDMTTQAIALARQPHVICATPGRLIDHLENTRGFTLRALRCLVLDEADRLLNLDFAKELDQLLTHIPAQRHTSLFSATMTSKVAKLQRASLTNPVKVEVSRKYQVSAGLKQMYVFLPAFHKDLYLAYICNEWHGQSLIIFTSTCDHAQHCTLTLRHLGFRAIPLHGRMTQTRRLGALNAFKSGSMTILVATDVASRGLDLPAVDGVVNYDIPQHSKDYIHRVGRTARAGRTGKSVTLVTQYDVELCQRIEALLGYQLSEYEGLEVEAVMLMKDRVAEAQRQAKLDMREMEEKKKDAGAGGKGGGGGRRGEDDGGMWAEEEGEGDEEVETDSRLGTRASAIGKSGRGRGGRGGGRGRGRGRGGRGRGGRH